MVIPLLKGVIYHESDPSLWNSLLNLQARVRDYVAVLGLGLVLGAIVGAALALLFTPFSGDEARRKISEQVDKVRPTEPSMTNGSTRPTSVSATPYVST